MSNKDQFFNPETVWYHHMELKELRVKNEDLELRVKILEMKLSDISRKTIPKLDRDLFIKYITDKYPPEKHDSMINRYLRNPTLACDLYCDEQIDFNTI